MHETAPAPLARLPLNALRAFESAARLRSMTQAGEELGVTHSAISRHVQRLEKHYGVILLRRLPQSVEPTTEGARLAAQLTAAFQLVHTGVAGLQPAPLTLSCSATIMQHWLIPRLSEFKTAHPHIELKLNVNYGEVNMVRDEISVALRNDMVDAPQNVILQPVITETIGLVCAPGMARHIRPASKHALASLPLLSTKTRPSAWAEWEAATALSAHSTRTCESFEHFYLLVQAAACGLGAAVVPRMIVENELCEGRLVAPFGFVPGPHKIVLWIAPHLRTRADLKALVNWLKQELRRSAAD